MGKTSFAINIARDVAKLKEKRVLFFTLEMNRETVIKRLISIEEGINKRIYGEDYQRI